MLCGTRVRMAENSLSMPIAPLEALSSLLNFRPVQTPWSPSRTSARIGSYLNQNSAALSAYSTTSLGKKVSPHFEALDTNSCKVLLMVTLVTDFKTFRYVSSWYRAGGTCDLPLPPPVSCFPCSLRGAFYFTAGAIAPLFTLKKWPGTVTALQLYNSTFKLDDVCLLLYGV